MPRRGPCRPRHGRVPFPGARVANTLQADPGIERVIGVDTVPPAESLGRTEFVRVDIRTPGIAKIIASAGVDTVVHLNLVTSSAASRAKVKELNVIGTMQLLAACQRSPDMRKLVVRSSAAVYGSSPMDPAVFTERDQPAEAPKTGYAKDAVEVEGYVRGLMRRRSDLTVSVLRFANFVGRASTRHSPGTCTCRSSRPCWGSTRGSSSSTRTTASRCCGA